MATFDTNLTIPWFSYAAELYKENHPDGVCVSADKVWASKVRIYLDALNRCVRDTDYEAVRELKMARSSLGNFIEKPTVAVLKAGRIDPEHARGLIVMCFGV